MHACLPKDMHCPSWPHAVPDHLRLLTLSRGCFSLPGRGGHKHTEAKQSVKEIGSKALEEPAAGTQVRWNGESDGHREEMVHAKMEPGGEVVRGSRRNETTELFTASS